jgi:hypothetical protein
MLCAYVYVCVCSSFPPFEIVNHLTDLNETFYLHYAIGAHTNPQNF